METFRVLRKGGKIQLCLRSEHSNSEGPGLPKIVEMLGSTGFVQIDSQRHNLGHGGIFVTAQKK